MTQVVITFQTSKQVRSATYNMTIGAYHVDLRVQRPQTSTPKI